MLELTAELGAINDPVRGTITQLLRSDDMIRSHPPQIPVNTALQQVPTLTEACRVTESEMRLQIQRLFRAETYVYIQEVRLLKDDNKERLLLGGEDHFIACASEYVRSGCHKDLRKIIAGFLTPQMRQIVVPSTAQHCSLKSNNHPCDTEDPCAICYEDFAEDESLPRTITYRCCKRPFHSECLLLWLQEKALDRERMTCPWCRTEVDTDDTEYLRGLFLQRL